MTNLHKIHQNEAQLQAAAIEETTKAVNVSCETLVKAIEGISVTKEIKIDFSETNELLKKLAEREDEPVNVTVKLNIL